MKTNKIYYIIPALALYGDMLKRFMRPDWALAIPYITAVLILVWIAMFKWNKGFLKSTPLDKRLSYVVYYLVAAYCIQLTLSIDVPFERSLTHVLYICVPLLYIPVILRYCPEFDLKKLSIIFLLMMIPINIVGLIQHFINPGFLISTAYGGDDGTGGIILRNSYQGAFMRFPSIFASADRYSAIGLMQFYFTVILLSLSNNRTKKTDLWICFNLISSIVTLCIAGARSRIFIVLLVMVLMALSSLKTPRTVLRKTFGSLTSIILTILIPVALMLAFNPRFIKQTIKVPSVDFLVTSIKEGDVINRIKEYIGYTLLPDDITLNGQGLGSLGYRGKPAEVGIESIWIECGLIGGLLIIAGFSGIILILVLLSWQALIKGQPLNVIIFSLPALVLLTGLLAGLTAVFELSSGIMLMSGIGGTIKQLQNTNAETANPLPCQQPLLTRRPLETKYLCTNSR